MSRQPETKKISRRSFGDAKEIPAKGEPLRSRARPSRGRVILNYLLIIVGTLLAVGPGLSYLTRILATKERITIGKTSKWLEGIHRARYEFAKPYCAGKRVADIAAGEGYGTLMLRDVATSVDAYDKLKFGDNIIINLEKEKWAKRYDVIVSLETVEHLANPDFFLRNVSETCDLAIISTPVGEPRGSNPFHKQTWTASEFKQLLERFFSCEFHSQDGNQFPLDDNPSREIVAVCKPVARPGWHRSLPEK